MRGRPTCPPRVLSALAAFLMLSAASSFAQTNDLQQMLIQATGLAASGDTERRRTAAGPDGRTICATRSRPRE